MAMKRLHVMGGFGVVSSSGCDFSTSEGPDGSLLSEELLLSSTTAEVGSGLFDIGEEASGSCSSMANLVRGYRKVGIKLKRVKEMRRFEGFIWHRIVGISSLMVCLHSPISSSRALTPLVWGSAALWRARDSQSRESATKPEKARDKYYKTVTCRFPCEG